MQKNHRPFLECAFLTIVEICYFNITASKFLSKKIIFHELQTVVSLEGTWKPSECVVCMRGQELNLPWSSSQALEISDACNSCIECIGREVINNYVIAISLTFPFMFLKI